MSIPVSALQNLQDLQTPPEEIKWRQGNKEHGGDCQKVYGKCQLPHKMLAYIDARFVMSVLDSPLVGPGNWQSKHTMDGAKVACSIGILIDYEDGQPAQWVWKSDGAGETDIEGEKGSFSDALKRAAVSWGIARDLYALKPQSGVAHNASEIDAIMASLPDIPPAPTPAAPAQAAGGPFPPIGSIQPPTCPKHHFVVKPPSEKAVRAGYTAWKCTGKTNGEWCNFTWTPPVG